MLGSWKINIDLNGMPQKVATAMGKLSEQLMGAEYTPIAYLGSQQVNGINHAVLAEQLVVTGKDTKNVVVIIFNEKPNEMEYSLVNIERVVESGGQMGGITVEVKTDIPAEAKEAFAKCFEGFVGSKVDPFALLGTQIVKGTNYIFAAEVTPVTPDPETKVAVVIVNAMTGDIAFTDMLGTKTDALQLGYAFTWLKRQNGSLGSPLGEWP
jgi:hypothetical protein